MPESALARDIESICGSLMQRVTFALACLICLSGCASDPLPPGMTSSNLDTAPIQSTSAPATVIVTRDDSVPGTPKRCSAHGLGEFLAAFEAGANSTGLASTYPAFIGDPSRFRWFADSSSSDRRTETTAQDWASLRTYFAARHTKGEKLTIKEVAVFYRSGDNTGNFAFIALRTAADLPSSSPVSEGKGAVACDTGLITVWSWGAPEKAASAPLCPPAPRGDSGLIICTQPAA